MVMPGEGAAPGLFPVVRSLLAPAALAKMIGAAYGLDAIPISLGPEDADGCRRDGWQLRGATGRGRSLEGEVAHLALDGARVVTRASAREALGADLGQQAG